MMKICPPVKKVGKDWDYKGRSEIVQILLDHDNIINYIQFQYVDQNGALVLSDGHGRVNGIKFTAVSSPNFFCRFFKETMYSFINIIDCGYVWYATL